MEFFRIKKDIPFMSHALIFNIVSGITFALAVFFLCTKGLNFSIEFTGGTVMEVTYQKAADLDAIRKTVQEAGLDAQVQNFGRAQDVMINLPVQEGVTAAQQSEHVMAILNANGEEAKLQRVEFVGPQIGDELAENGAMALGFVILGIIIYLAFRFQWKYAVSAILANLHDVIIVLGFFSFFEWEFSLSVLAGVIAVMGYSVNESVIIFDRIRENFRKMRKTSVQEVINHAITSTISRTMITHGSTEAMVIFMLLCGGPTLHNFALALTIGICFSIYSSVFVSATLAMWLGIKREDLIKPINREKRNSDGAVV